MIVPITKETEWLKKLQGLPPFEAGGAPIVLISPHPDDECLAAGGLIADQCQKGREVVILAVTNGENAYINDPGLAALRIKEQDCAVEVLSEGKARIVKLGLVDSGVSEQFNELVGRLREFVSEQTHLVAPFVGDYHPDHEACGRAARVIAAATGCRLSWYLFWTWHRGTPSDLEGLSLEMFALDSALQKKKLDALSCHRSQLEHPDGEPILPDNLLAPARRSFEVFARL